MITRGIMAEGPEFMLLATGAVQTFFDFSADNDPDGEYDFGPFNLAGHRLFWKFNCYDRDLRYGSDDPAVTSRVLTIMLTSEY